MVVGDNPHSITQYSKSFDDGFDNARHIAVSNVLAILQIFYVMFTHKILVNIVDLSQVVLSATIYRLFCEDFDINHLAQSVNYSFIS
jgi:hypothetical protein